MGKPWKAESHCDTASIVIQGFWRPYNSPGRLLCPLTGTNAPVGITLKLEMLQRAPSSLAPQTCQSRSGFAVLRNASLWMAFIPLVSSAVGFLWLRVKKPPTTTKSGVGAMSRSRSICGCQCCSTFGSSQQRRQGCMVRAP